MAGFVGPDARLLELPTTTTRLLPEQTEHFLSLREGSQRPLASGDQAVQASL